MTKNNTHEMTIRLAFAADHSATPSVVLASVTALGVDATKVEAELAAVDAGKPKQNGTDWARQMSTAAQLFVIVHDPEDTDSADSHAEACITRAKASSKSTGDCKAKGSGQKLVGAVKRLAEEKSQKAALADIRKAQGQGRRRGPGGSTSTGEPALVKAVKAKVAAFEKARVDNSRTVEAKAREILAALDELQKIAQKADEALVSVSVAGEELAA